MNIYSYRDGAGKRQREKEIYREKFERENLSIVSTRHNDLYTTSIIYHSFGFLSSDFANIQSGAKLSLSSYLYIVALQQW